VICWRIVSPLKYPVLGVVSTLVVSCSIATADARKDLENDLQKLYEHKLLSFRVLHSGNKLQFDLQ